VKRLIGSVLGYLEQSMNQASAICEFSLAEGHPDYPVMWGFGFVIMKPRYAVVFLGSSSD
jgi:hypothetical protein